MNGSGTKNGNVVQLPKTRGPLESESDLATLRNERHESDAALAELDALLPSGSGPVAQGWDDEVTTVGMPPQLPSAPKTRLGEVGEVAQETLGMFQGNGARIAVLVIISLTFLIGFAIYRLSERLPVLPVESTVKAP